MSEESAAIAYGYCRLRHGCTVDCRGDGYGLMGFENPLTFTCLPVIY